MWRFLRIMMLCHKTLFLIHLVIYWWCCLQNDKDRIVHYHKMWNRSERFVRFSVMFSSQSTNGTKLARFYLQTKCRCVTNILRGWITCKTVFVIWICPKANPYHSLHIESLSFFITLFYRIFPTFQRCTPVWWKSLHTTQRYSRGIICP